ncbi:unnamed protein product [Closterium sp. NIES-53]
MSARLQAASSLTALGAATAAIDSSQSQQLSSYRIRLRLRDSSWCLGDSQWSRSVRGCRATIVTRGRRGWSPLRIVAGDVGGQYEESFGDVESRLVDFFTFKAVRHILRTGATAGDEEDREEVEWLRRHVEANTRRDSKLFLRNLVQEQRNVAERVMEIRLQLFNKWALKYDQTAMEEELRQQNLELLRERLLQTVRFSTDPTLDDDSADAPPPSKQA